MINYFSFIKQFTNKLFLQKTYEPLNIKKNSNSIFKLNKILLKPKIKFKPVIKYLKNSNIKLFKFYINLILFNYSNLYNIHYTFKYLYLKYVKSGPTILSINKFFNK